MDLTQLGFTKEEIEDKVIESICATVLADTHLDEEGNPTSHRSPFYRRMTEEINKRMNERIAALGAQHIEPNITALIEGTVLQRTNEWGEKKGEPKTFIQYLTERAEAYVVEPVSYDGKTKAQDSYNWRASTTRIAYMIDAHLQYSIKTAMEKALADANTSITKGIADAVKLALAEVQQKLKVSVVTK